MVKKFIVGVVCSWRICKIQIENLLHKISEVKLKIVADIKLDNQLKQWATEIGIPYLTTDADEIFTDPEINVVAIASSTDTHAEFIQKAAQAKKHIFCEKPIYTYLNRLR